MMQLNETLPSFEILQMHRSKESLKLTDEVPIEQVKFALLPLVIFDESNNLSSVVLTSLFTDGDGRKIANDLSVTITYKFLRELPVKRDDNNGIVITNYADFLAMLETSVDSFRGVLFEWLNGSLLQRPMPILKLSTFLRDLRMSFSK